MKLVTVTCSRDWKLMVLQAVSVQRYVNPCTHIVIVNDQDPHEIDWEGLLRPIYTKHTLEIVYADPAYWEQIHNGWVIQQVLKLEAVKLANEDYLLLDSKNFFVVNTDINNWQHEGSGILISKEINRYVWDLWNNTSTMYSQLLDMPLLDVYYAPETPYVVRQSVALAAIDRPNWGSWFISNSLEHDASEFIYYSYFLKQEDHEFRYNRRHHSLWPEHANASLQKWFDEDDFAIMEISGIHRVWLEKAAPADKQLMREWLAGLGLLNEHTVAIIR